MNAIPLPQIFDRLKCGQFLSLFFAVSIAAGYVLHSVDGSALQHHRHRTPPPGLMVGTYQGSVMEGGLPAIHDDPVVTKFSRLPNGTVIGEYQVLENGQKYVGHLVQHGALEDHAATFDWTDQFGHGTLEMKFDDDYCSFEGRWSNSDATMIDEPWTGRRR